MSPGKGYCLLADLINDKLLRRSEHAQKKWLKSNHPYTYALVIRYLCVNTLKIILDVMSSTINIYNYIRFNVFSSQ